MINWPNFFRDLYNNVLNMLRSMEHAIKFLTTPLINFTGFQINPTSLPSLDFSILGVEITVFTQMMSFVITYMLNPVLSLFTAGPIGLINTFIRTIGVGEMITFTPLGLIVSYGIFITATLLLIKALVPLL